MSRISIENNESIQRLYTETEQVATAMNEMTATVQEVAANISHTADAAHDANLETTAGTKVVESTVNRINNLEDHTDIIFT